MAVLAGLVAGRSDLPQTANLVHSSAVPAVQVCIDDSDCHNLDGGAYACFQYICYPYENDNMARDKKQHCWKTDDCGPNQVCHRHPERRKISFGLCMEEWGDCRENGERDCKGMGPNKCCNGQYCCEQEYFDQLKKLPCVNDMMCKDLGYGAYCCPDKININGTNVCCDVNPNPPTTTTVKPPRAGTLSGSPSLHAVSQLVALGLLAYAALG